MGSESTAKSGQSLAMLLAKRAGSIDKGFRILTNSILGACFFLIACIVASEAFLRYVMRNVPLGLEEIALLIAAWAYFLGIAITTRERRHVTVNILHLVPIPPRILRYIDLVPYFIVVGVSGIFAYIAIVYCWDVYAADIRLPPYYWPATVRTLSVAVGLVLTSLYFFAQLVSKLRTV